MVRFMKAWMLVLAALLAMPAAIVWAQADNSTPASTTGTATKDDSKSEEEDSSSFFPGVRGISGAELERIIREREARQAEEERKARRYADNRQNNKDGEEKKPSSTTTEKKPSEPPKMPTPAPTPAPVKTEVVKEPPLSKEAAEFMRKQKLAASRVEYYLPKAADIRADADKVASANDSEELIQYILQYTKRTNEETQAYVNNLSLPVAVYQYLFDQCQQGLVRDRKSRPADLTPTATAQADACVKQFKAGRTACLLASAELYTRMRKLEAAEAIFAVLLKENPKDEALNKSHQAFVAVKTAEKPTTPPGVRTGGGGSGSRGRDTDENGEPLTPAESFAKKYSR